MRPLCSVCQRNSVAINRYYKGKVYYRSKCNSCIRRKRKLPPQIPRWKEKGYTKKPTCDRCGFRARYSAQLLVYHVDGNLNNCSIRNLKTICLNCVVAIPRLDLPWQPGDLEPDI